MGSEVCVVRCRCDVENISNVDTEKIPVISILSLLNILVWNWKKDLKKYNLIVSFVYIVRNMCDAPGMKIIYG